MEEDYQRHFSTLKHKIPNGWLAQYSRLRTKVASRCEVFTHPDYPDYKIFSTAIGVSVEAITRSMGSILIRFEMQHHNPTLFNENPVEAANAWVKHSAEHAIKDTV